MRTGLAFLASSPLDYGRRLARRRWCRAVPADCEVELLPSDRASRALEPAGAWVVVREETALPAGPPRFPFPPPGHLLLTRVLAAERIRPLHTIREFEVAPVPAGEPGPESLSAAVSFFSSDFHPRGDETVASFLERLIGSSSRQADDPSFRVLLIDDSSERERPELSSLIPEGAARLLDVGCGRGGTSAALKARASRLHVTGVERDPRAAARARQRLDLVIEGDAIGLLERLVAEEERYDAFLFADVLEHLEDPIRALSLARSLAAPGATLVASVPNVGHLSLVRDLLLGRFDPAPAGLAAAGHLRWFDRRLLAEALEEASWRVLSIEREPGAPAPDAEEFLARFASWPALDRESLLTYQWIAVARPAARLDWERGTSAPPGDARQAPGRGNSRGS